MSICSLAADEPFLVVLIIQSFTVGFENISVLCAPSFFPSQTSLPVLSIILLVIKDYESVFDAV